ncbi:hypothetical protein [Streptomyces sp. NBC_01518]|uniref:hypothetical protein n=1 Tax=Streptomyces sp. NBC_01518 TaxID=2903891 RepID=UPI00386A499D
MSLPILAIIISSASAAFTLSNWLTSLATFRRGGPRLKVKVKLRARHLPDAHHADDATKWKAAWHAHVVNTGAAAIEVEKAEIAAWSPPLLLVAFTYPGRMLVSRFFNWDPFIDLPPEIIWLEGEDKRRIEAYGGARWAVLDSLPDMTDKQVVGMSTSRGLGLLTFRVTLTNGQEVNSWPVLLLKVHTAHKAVRGVVTALKEALRQAEEQSSRQLTFDDLSTEQQKAGE